jgi:hypothetical protein
MPFLQYGSNTDVGDANAFRGTLSDFLAFIGQGDSMTAQEVWAYPLSNADGQNGNAGEYLGGANQYAYHGGQAAWRAEYLARGLAAMADPIIIPANPRLDIAQESVPNKLAQALHAGSGGGGGAPATYVVSLSGSMSGSATPQS